MKIILLQTLYHIVATSVLVYAYIRTSDFTYLFFLIIEGLVLYFWSQLVWFFIVSFWQTFQEQGGFAKVWRILNGAKE